MIKKLCLPFLLVLAACPGLPDTQPLIDSAVELKRLGDAELAKHRLLVSKARFDMDPMRDVELRAEYTATIDRHARTSDQLVQAIINWAQRIGQFDPQYVNQTLEQIVDTYLRLREAGGT